MVYFPDGFDDKFQKERENWFRDPRKVFTGPTGLRISEFLLLTWYQSNWLQLRNIVLLNFLLISRFTSGLNKNQKIL